MIVGIAVPTTVVSRAATAIAAMIPAVTRSWSRVSGASGSCVRDTLGVYEGSGRRLDRRPWAPGCRSADLERAGELLRWAGVSGRFLGRVRPGVGEVRRLVADRGPK